MMHQSMESMVPGPKKEEPKKDTVAKPNDPLWDEARKYQGAEAEPIPLVNKVETIAPEDVEEDNSDNPREEIEPIREDDDTLMLSPDDVEMDNSEEPREDIEPMEEGREDKKAA